MDSFSLDVEEVNKGQGRPEPGPEDKIVSAYLEDRSEVYRDLVKVQDDVWKNPQANARFKRQCRRADNPKPKDLKTLFFTKRDIGEEIDAVSGSALSLPDTGALVLDLCMAPGGYTASVLKHSRHAIVDAFTLPPDLGGHPIHRSDPRVSVMFGDITMLHKEFRVKDIPKNHPEFPNLDGRRLWEGRFYNLIFCDGQLLRTHQAYIADYRRQVEPVRLRVSQLILAMWRIRIGGTLIMLLHDVGAYETIKILSVFDKVAEIQLFKPVSSHTKRGTFYLIAKNVQPRHPEAVAAVDEWRKVWKKLTFPVLGRDGHRNPLKVAKESQLAPAVLGLLENFAERVIELGEPIWQAQKEALATAAWTKKKKRETNSGQVDTGEASTAPTDNATVAVHDSKEDLDGIRDPDDVDAPVLGMLPKTIATGPADSANVSAAMEKLNIDS